METCDQCYAPVPAAANKCGNCGHPRVPTPPPPFRRVANRIDYAKIEYAVARGVCRAAIYIILTIIIVSALLTALAIVTGVFEQVFPRRFA